MSPEDQEAVQEDQDITKEEYDVLESKGYRRELDDVLQRIKTASRNSQERNISIMKIQEAIMWLGMDLKAINDGVSCYRHGYDNTPIVEPTADGVKL